MGGEETLSAPGHGQDSLAFSWPALQKNKGISVSNIPTSETEVSLAVPV